MERERERELEMKRQLPEDMSPPNKRPKSEEEEDKIESMPHTKMSISSKGELSGGDVLENYTQAPVLAMPCLSIFSELITIFCSTLYWLNEHVFFTNVP